MIFLLNLIFFIQKKKLVEAGIVKKLQPAKVDDLLGEADNLGCLAEKQMQRMPDPSYQQLRQVIIFKSK